MSSNKTSSEASTTNHASMPATEPKDKSDYAIVKEGGWTSGKNMMESYGLRIGDATDHAEAKQIKEAFREYDQHQYEDAQKK
ncbi:hypothetical protein D0Z07_1943 [Hyphodiscus hymeniophilus]|uniref:Uncharacterized protein n=1 Tax=Hyphodiscus hymeniophilus TaxID=353542 RepID=A0A9P7AZ17_9HELO|nr:hypothetical protein D0Z07_1943 [Hyphodiscus hymeniophilus]